MIVKGYGVLVDASAAQELPSDLLDLGVVVDDKMFFGLLLERSERVLSVHGDDITVSSQQYGAWVFNNSEKFAAHKNIWHHIKSLPPQLIVFSVK